MIENDGLPNRLCAPCVSKLDSAVNFKSLCERSDSLFRQYISGKVADFRDDQAFIKQEESADNQYDGNVEISGDYDDFFFKAEPEIQLNEDKPVSEKTDNETGKLFNFTNVWNFIFV